MPAGRPLTSAPSFAVNRPRITEPKLYAVNRPPRCMRTMAVHPQPIGNGSSLHAIGNDTRWTVRAWAGPRTSKLTRGSELLPDSHAPALGTAACAGPGAAASVAAIAQHTRRSGVPRRARDGGAIWPVSVFCIFILGWARRISPPADGKSRLAV